MDLTGALIEILQAFKQGQQTDKHFEWIYLHYHAPVYRFFLRQKISEENALELTQNTFLSVYTRLKDLRQDEQFENWLWQIARRELSRKWEKENAQKRKGQMVSLDGTNDAESDEIASLANRLSDSVPNPQEQLLERETSRLVREAMQQLPEQMRRCIELRVVLDLQYHEIAMVMNISINTVKSHLFHAREQLRKRLGDYFKEIG